MRLYACVIDQEWFDYARSQPQLDEVNFWQPSPNAEFHRLSKGDLFLFKLHRSARMQWASLNTVKGEEFPEVATLNEAAEQGHLTIQGGADWRPGPEGDKELEKIMTAGQRYVNKRKPGGDDFSVL